MVGVGRCVCGGVGGGAEASKLYLLPSFIWQWLQTAVCIDIYARIKLHQFHV